MTLRLSVEEYRRLAGGRPKPKSKFKSTRVRINGKSFDSLREGSFYLMLLRSYLEGDVKRFFLQVPISLCEETNQKYLVDFLVFDADETPYYIDVKGVETKAFKLKKAMIEPRHSITIQVVKDIRSLIPEEMIGTDFRCTTIRDLNRFRVPSAMHWLGEK